METLNPRFQYLKESKRRGILKCIESEENGAESTREKRSLHAAKDDQVNFLEKDCSRVLTGSDYDHDT